MGKEKTFGLFLGCLMPNRYPQIEKATKFVMGKLGYTLLDLEGATCCPAPGVFRSFNKFDWYVTAARNLCIAEKKNSDVMTVCNGCFGTLQEANHKLKTDEDLRERVNSKLKKLCNYQFQGTIEVRHIAEVLGWEVGPDEIQEYLVRKVRARAAIHYGCHFLKPTRVREIESAEAPTILEEYAESLGIESVEFQNKHTCCGAGGGVKAAHGDACAAIFAEKMRNIDAVAPDFILDICPFCHLQFETGQNSLNQNAGTKYDYPVIHIAQLTAYCMGMDEKFVGLQYQQMGRSFIFPQEAVEADN